MASPQQPPSEAGVGSLADLEGAIGYQFRDIGLLETALTHSSYSVENGGIASYERLEFLGDAVLELITTEIIFDLFPDEREGSMTKLRASVVDVSTLGSIARSLSLGTWVRLGVGEKRSGGAERDSILSDVVEAILGAMFIDGGMAPASAFVRARWTERITANAGTHATTDPRSRLQELLARSGRTVEFAYRSDGPDHDVRFTADAMVEGEVIGQGTAGSKKGAAIDASRDALKRLGT